MAEDDEIDLMDFLSHASALAPVTEVRVAPSARGGRQPIPSIGPDDISLESLEEVDANDLPRLQKYLMRFGDFRERTKKHTRCFSGSTFTNFLLSRGLAKSREEARQIGQKMVLNRLMVHVEVDQAFQDNSQLYRFVDPEAFMLSIAMKDPAQGAASLMTKTSTPSTPRLNRAKSFDAAPFLKGAKPVSGTAMVDWLMKQSDALHLASRSDAVRIVQQMLDDFLIRPMHSTSQEFKDDATQYIFTRESVAVASFVDCIIKESALCQYEKKKWKARFFALPAEQQRLYFYKHETDLTPRGVVELRQSVLRPLDSHEGRRNVIQIVTGDGPFNLAFPNEEERDRWLSRINMAVREQSAGVGSGDDSRQTRCLRIKVCEGRDLPASTFQSNNYYAVLSFGESAAVRTQVAWRVKNGAPQWEDEFRFDDLPLSVEECRVTVYSRGKLAQDTELGSCTINVSRLGSHVESDEWMPLVRPTSADKDKPDLRAQMEKRKSTDSLDARHHLSPHHHQHSDKTGAVRVWCVLEYELILPLSSYTPFLDILMDDMRVPASLLSITSREREQTTVSVLRIMGCHDKAIPFLLHLVEKELEASTETNVLFRVNTMATKAIVAYLKMYGLGYLRSIIKPTVRRLVKAAAAAPDETIPLPVFEHLVLLWEDITRTATSLPLELKHLFVKLAALVEARFPASDARDPSKEPRLMAINSFLFLRFICPALISPKPYGINEASSVDSRVAKALKRIARIMQYLANFKPDVKEDEDDRIDEGSIDGLRIFVKENIPVMRGMVLDIAKETPERADELAMSGRLNYVDLPREVAAVYCEVIRCNQEMLDLLREPLRGKLTAVLDDISALYKAKWPGRSTPYQLHISLADAMMFLK